MGREFGLYGIFGFPLGHTLSPAMQEAAFQAVGLKAFYLPFEVRAKEFRALMRRRSCLLLDGFNVTVPYKREVMKYLDGSTPEARAIQAVNTVYQKGGRWLGANTDVNGFLISLKKEGRFDPKTKNVLVLGAGGAARAVAYGLAKSGACEVRIANRLRYQFRREKIRKDFRPLFPKTKFIGLNLNRNGLRKGLEGVDLVINATSVGVLYEDVLIPASLIPSAASRKEILFFDLVYHKPTRFLETARKRGHRVLDGRNMLVYQGAEAFRLWTGKRAPVAVMRKAIW